MLLMFGSLVAVVAVAVLLKKAKKMMNEEDSQSSKIAVVPAAKTSKWNLTPNDIQKAASHAKVEKTEDEAAKAHDAAVQEIQRHQSQAQWRLMKRLEKRHQSTST